MSQSVTTDGEVTRIEGVTSVAPEPQTVHPEAYGRYAVIEVIGSGGMGEVIRAYDPKLRREVALKRLHAHVLGFEPTARLIREAQAMARLSHPNVVAVYDVELDAEAVVLAMELVPGKTLRDWIDEDHPWREVLDAFVQAGRGLAAAHAVGIAHRDFKPGNVLVGDDGRVKVTDFGLARGTTEEPVVVEAVSPPSGDGISLDSDLTGASHVIGTPRYMAPEQHYGQAVGVAADQFAFCVALWEGLTGAPPYLARTVDDIAQEKLEGPPAWPEADPVPRSIVAAIRRGLSPEVSDRFETMDALLRMLADEPQRRRRVWLLGGGALVLIAGALALAPARGRADPCSGGRARMDAVWSSEAREEIADAFARTGIGVAASATGRLQAALDDYADRWVQQHTEACEATMVSHEQPAATMDLRMRCLDRAAADLDAALTLLRVADPELVPKAVELVSALPDPARCGDVDALTAEVPPPSDPEVAARVEALRTELAGARTQLEAGRNETALEGAWALQDAAQATGYAPLMIEVDLVLGRALAELARHEEAREVLDVALSRALRDDLPRLAVHAGVPLARVIAQDPARFDEAMRIGWVCLQLAQRLGDATLEADARISLGRVEFARGRFADAAEQIEIALQIRQGAFPEGHPKIAEAHNDLGEVLMRSDRFDEALDHYRRALAAREAWFGPDHLRVAGTRLNIANLYAHVGRREEALAEEHKVLEIREKALPPDHPAIASVHNNIANLYFRLGRDEEAAAEHRTVLAMRERILGEDNRDTALSHSNLGNALGAIGRYEEAEEHHRKAVEIWRKVLGDHHPDVAMGLHNLGWLLDRRGRFEQAEPLQREAIAIWTEVHGPEHNHVATARNVYGVTLYRLGRLDEAETELRAALRLRRGESPPRPGPIRDSRTYLGIVLAAKGGRAEARELLEPVLQEANEAGDAHAQAEAAWGLALALGDDPTNAARARELARQARRLIGDSEGTVVARPDEIDAWLDAHRR